MFFSQLLTFILELGLKFVSFFMAVIMVPISIILKNFLPDFDIYLTTIATFFEQYVIKGVAFAREVFINITGFPRELLSFLVVFFLFKLGLMLSKLALKGLYNAYLTLRGHVA